MIEAWGDDLNQEKFMEAMEFGVEEAYKIIELIKTSATEQKLIKESLSSEIVSENQETVTNEVKMLNEKFHERAYTQIYEILTNYSLDKKSRDESLSQVRNSVVNVILKNEAKLDPILKTSVYTYQALSELFSKFTKEIIRNLVLEESKRVDGRKLDQLRPIDCKTNLYKSLHGSALFQRGQTQVLCSITFDSPDSMYRSDSVVNMMSPSLTNFDKNFMLHYEFPSYATNEISRVGGRADRREIGHGALAEKALYPMLPTDYPLTIRALCEVLESNGSSSMASVCAGSMALMDAGVPIKRSVCGVAMGIITKNDEDDNIVQYKILTDISGFEDYYGDMDFKVAGTEEGITALQVN